MNGIRLCGFRGVVASLILLAIPCDARAGFQWLDYYWHGAGSGTRWVRDGYDLPDGTVLAEAYTEASGGFLGSNPPMNQHFSSSSIAYRKFSLSGSPGGWDVDLDLVCTQWSRFTIHMFNFGGMNIRVTTTLPESLPIQVSSSFSAPPPMQKTIRLSDGVYWAQFGVEGRLDFVPPLWQGTVFEVYHGQYAIKATASLKATAVPEPASWLMIGHGLFAAAGIAFVSKFRRCLGGRTAYG